MTDEFALEINRFALVQPSVDDIVVNNRAQHDAAAEMLAGVKDLKKEVARFYKKLKDPLNEKRNQILAWEKEDRQKVEHDETILVGKIQAYRERENRRAEKLAEAKRKKLEAEAAAEHARVLATLEHVASTDDDEAEAAIADMERAAIAAQGPAHAVVTTKRPDFSGSPLTEVKRWTPEVHDLKALCRAVADGVVPEDLILPNWVQLRKRATALGTEMAAVTPGCSASQTKGLSRGR